MRKETKNNIDWIWQAAETQLIGQFAHDLKFECLTPAAACTKRNMWKNKKKYLLNMQAKVAQLIGKLTHDLKFEGLALTVTDTKRK
jgi:hypothetical protein